MLFILLLAARGLFVPAAAARGFGIPIENPADLFYLHVKGDRDLSTALITAALLAAISVGLSVLALVVFELGAERRA